MPQQQDDRFYVNQSMPPGTSSTTTFDLAATSALSSSSGAFSLEFKNEDTSSNEKTLHELRVYTDSTKTTLAARITWRPVATCETAGTPTITKDSTIDPAAVDDSPAFPRTVDHSALRTWSRAVTNGSVIVAQYSASLDVRGDGTNGYTLDQSVLEQTNTRLKLEYTVRQGSVTLASGTLQFDTTTTVQSPLVAGAISYNDDFT